MSAKDPQELKPLNCIERKKIAKRATHQRYWKNNPWISHYEKAKERCESKNHKYYYSYGGKGIKFLTTTKDFKFLWLRDKAYLMKEPSIHRENSNGHYELTNCKFIEKRLNCSLDNRGEKNHNSKLKVNHILDIRKSYKENISQDELAIKYGIHPKTVCKIVNYKSWKHV